MGESSSNNKLLLKFISNIDDIALQGDDRHALLALYNVIINHELTDEEFKIHLTISSKDIHAVGIYDYLDKLYHIRHELINDSSVRSIFVQTIDEYFLPKILQIQEQIHILESINELDETLSNQHQRHVEEKKMLEEYEQQQSEAKWQKMLDENRRRRQNKLDKQEQNRAKMQQRHEDTMREIKKKHQDRLRHQEMLRKGMQERFEQQQQERIERSALKKRMNKQRFNDYVDRIERDRLVKLSLNYMRQYNADIYEVLDVEIINSYIIELETIDLFLKENLSIYTICGLYLLMKNFSSDITQFEHDIIRVEAAIPKNQTHDKQIVAALIIKLKDLRISLIQDPSQKIEEIERVVFTFFATKINSLIALLQYYDQVHDPSFMAFIKVLHLKGIIVLKDKDDIILKIHSLYQHGSSHSSLLKEKDVLASYINLENSNTKSKGALNLSLTSRESDESVQQKNKIIEKNLVFLPGYDPKSMILTMQNVKEKELLHRIHIGLYRYLSMIIDGLEVIQPEHLVELYFIIKDFAVSPKNYNDQLDIYLTRLNTDESMIVTDIEDYITQLHVELNSENFYSVAMQQIVSSYLNDKILMVIQTIINSELAKGYMYRYEDTLIDERERFSTLAKKYKLEEENNHLVLVCDDLRNSINKMNSDNDSKLTAVERNLIHEKRIELSRYDTIIKNNQRKLDEYNAVLNEIRNSHNDK